ncbi:MAG TPA: hypothetical protein VF092_11075 [Longimicrobium sp.]
MKAPRQVALDVVRQALRAAIERDGLRPAARAVGMTPTGLAKSLDEAATPRSSTQRKMREWYVRNGRGLGPDEETIRIALGLLLEGLPDPAMTEGRRAVVDVLRRVYRSTGMEPPRWMAEIEE